MGGGRGPRAARRSPCFGFPASAASVGPLAPVAGRFRRTSARILTPSPLSPRALLPWRVTPAESSALRPVHTVACPFGLPLLRWEPALLHCPGVPVGSATAFPFPSWLLATSLMLLGPPVQLLQSGRLRLELDTDRQLAGADYVCRPVNLEIPRVNIADLDPE